MWRRQKYLAALLAGIVVSLASGAPKLRINGLDATVPLKVEGKDKLIISVAGAGDVNEQGYSVICEDRGRLEPVSGLNEVNDGNATAYRFVFDDDWEFGTVLVVADQNMVIDGISVTAGTEVYKLFLFYSLQADATSVIGIDFEGLSWVAPEPQAEQTPVSEDSASDGGTEEEPGEVEMLLQEPEYTLPLAAGNGYDPTMDLNADGKIDFKDFAILAAGWQTTYDIYDLDTMCDAFGSTDTCADTNVSGVWRDQFFTGIGGCGLYDCWFGEDYSDYIYDNCGNLLYVVCQETPEFDYYCAYNFRFNSRRVGLCIYTCGLNAFQVRKNTSGSRILQTRHRTQDRLIYGCDEGTSGKYDWQVVVYDDNTHLKTGYCRESYSDPSVNNYWDPNQGQVSACENVWW